MFYRLIFVVFLFFIACSSEDDEVEDLYAFPELLADKLADLKTTSEEMEGFFITTDLSDLDQSYADRGFYLYVCLRFLNDETLNSEIKKSAIPLLIQAGNQQDQPVAESVLLLHPKTKKANGDYQFYYEESQKFELQKTFLTIKEQEYHILDVTLNSEGRIASLTFLKKDTKLSTLKRPVRVAKDDQNNEDESSTGNDSPLSTDEQKTVVLKVESFAKQFSSSCDHWPILNYTHSKETPWYLGGQRATSNSNKAANLGDGGGSSSQNLAQTGVGLAHNNPYWDASSSPNEHLTNTIEGGGEGGVPAIPAQTLIPESAPYKPVQKDHFVSSISESPNT